MKHYLTMLFFLVAVLIVASGSVYAQTITAGTYTFSRSGFAPTTLTSPIQLIGANSDDVASAVTNIGFTFWFAGTAYTQFSVNENGLMTLGSTQISGSESINQLQSGTTIPKIAPYWDDLATGSNGSVVYQVTGTAPNRILIINWNLPVPKNVGGTANALIQVQLSETSGLINFTYGSPAVPANAGQYSIGIGNSATDFASVTPTSTVSATCAYGVANNAVTISPGVYTRYSFTPDRTAPTITYTALANTLLLDNRTLSATIADSKTGVPTTGSLTPRLYYKKNYIGTYTSVQGTLTAGNSASGTWSFLIDHTAVGGVAPRDSIYYYVIAQDQASTLGVPNIASNPTGVSAIDVNTITTHPVAPTKYKILGALISGLKTVGISGADYTSLTKAGGLFEDISDGKLTGNVTVNIITDLTGESTAKALSAWVNDVGGPYTLTINPVGPRTVAGGLKLNGTIGLTIDGLNDGTNSLTLPGLLFSFGASNNTITRTTINGQLSFNDASGSFAANCSNNNINNSVINATGVQSAFYFGSWATAAVGTNNIINNNVIKNFGQYGIHLDRGYRNFTISNNDIFQTAGGNYSTGIYIYNEAGATSIFNNKIHDITSGTGLGVWTAGIYYRTGLSTDVLDIYNNVITLDATTVNTAAYQLIGLFMSGAGTSNIYYNSIYIGGVNVASGNSAGIHRIGGTVNFKNNAIYNARSGSASSLYYKNFGIVAYNLTNFTSDNNLVFANGINGVIGNVGTGNLGQNTGTYYASLPEWQAGTSEDLSSFSGDPGFTSVTDLTPDVTNPGSNILNSRGTPIATIGTDILGNARSTALPVATDIGAYEFTPTPVITFTISGNVGVAGATLSWNDGGPQTVVSDPSGNYSITVSYSWSGTITPSLSLHTFTPAQITYTNVLADQINQNYTAAVITFAISGNTGIPGVTLSWTDITPKTAVTDGTGAYSISVTNNWSGTVTPSLAGYTFTPANIAYANVVTDQVNQNYTATAITYTVSGNTGVPGVTLSWTDGTPKVMLSDGTGAYSLIVSYNWSGTVTPTLAGYTFTPANIVYTNVLADQINQNYTAAPTLFTISGNAGIAGTTLSWTDGTPKTTLADGTGAYLFTVSYNWSGVVTPSLSGYLFTPASITYTNVLANQVNQNYTAAVLTHTISGNTGVGGVTLSWTDGVPKVALSDGTGAYSISVSNNWSGTVTPTLAGYTFTPANIAYTNVLADQINQNYTSTPTVFTISGNAGIAGATLSWTDGTPKTTLSDGTGAYSFTVSYNWSGTVTPAISGYTFTPANLTYTNVLSNQVNQNYTVGSTVFTISGNAGFAGVTLSWTDGTSKTVLSDGTGAYSFIVSYNWSGTVTPSLTSYTFTPANIAYTNVLLNQVNQNYTATAITYTISGNAGIAGATLSWTDSTSKTTLADGTGAYSITVSYNWSGTVTPSLTGFTFTPANVAYANVLANQLNQNYTSTPTIFTISGNAGAAGASLSYTDGVPKTATADAGGLYSFTVSYNWSGTVTPSLAGYTFNPVNRTYSNVVSDQVLQNYIASQTIILADIKIFLQGPFITASTLMTTNLNSILPLNSDLVYSGAINGYSPRSVASIPSTSIVDWILVELRTGTTANTKVMSNAGFLLDNGSIVDIDGSSPLSFAQVDAGNYYIVVKHRNHLAVISSVPIALSTTSTTYDFTAANHAGGTNPMIDLTGAGTVFGMYAGNNDNDNLISANDYNDVGLNLFSNGYLISDHNLNGFTTTEDYNFVGGNIFKVSQVQQ